MATEILMPRLTDTMLQGVISHWYKKEGESVAEDEPLFMVETDKANVEVNASAAGVLLKVFCGEGESVDVGERVAIIGASGEDIQPLLTSTRPAAAEKKEEPVREKEGPAMRIKASPAAKRRAKSENVDLTKIAGTGEGGLITEKDIEAYLRKGSAVSDSLRKYGPEERIPLEGIRKVMTEKMTLSLQIPQVTTVAESDVSDLMKLSKEKSVTITAFVIRAVVEGLRAYPLINASLEGEEVILKNYFNIGVSVASPRGLVVPILHNAEKKDIQVLSKELSDLAQKARENRLVLEEISGGTFTVTNSGVFGALFSTPRIHPPESAILGLGKIMKQPVVIGEEIAVRSMMYLCLSYDHRIIDGETAVKFLQEVKKNLESPQAL
jgi:pyruvate/2-oxoglutarate dehydrogenase complex dihydrolipoamide acyltransferase (E2) component